MSTTINNYIILSADESGKTSRVVRSHAVNGSTETVSDTTTFNELLKTLSTRPEAIRSAEKEMEARKEEEELTKRYELLRRKGLLEPNEAQSNPRMKSEGMIRVGRRPGARQLRQNEDCIARIDFAPAKLEVFANGYAIYDNGNRKTVLWVPDCGSVTYRFNDLKENEARYMTHKEVLGLDILGVLPWFNALVVAGEDQIERNLDHPKSEGTISDVSTLDYEVEPSHGWLGVARFEGPEEAYLRKSAQEEKRTAMTEKQNEVYKLYYEDGYTMQEIAEKLGVGLSAVHYRINSAHKRMKTLLDTEISGNAPKKN